MLKLIIEDDEGRKTVVPFVRDEITIGRQEGNTIRLTERNVSRRHARLVRLNGHVVVEDLGSYNGTRINGERIAGQSPLKEGDLIQIGDYDLALQTEGAANVSGPITTKVPSALRKTEPALESLSAQKTEEEEAPASQPPPEDEDEPNPPPPASAEARRHSTSIIRLDQVEADRPRRVVNVAAEDAPRLLVLTPDELKGQEFACIRTELRIGRTDDNDIALDHRSLSRTHAKLVREEGGEWRVIDMQSANGLAVNGESYAQATLDSGDVIELGHVKLRFLQAGHAADSLPSGEGGSRSKLPMVAGLLALLVGAGAVGFYFFRPPMPGTPVMPVTLPGPDTEPPSGVPQPSDGPPPAHAATQPEPEELPAPTELSLAERLSLARQAIDAREFDKAGDYLSSAKDAQGRQPGEVKTLLDQIGAEQRVQQQLVTAEAALTAGKLTEAEAVLTAISGTRIFAPEHSKLMTRLADAKQKAAAAATKPPPTTNTNTVAAAGSTEPAASPTVEKLLSGIRDLLKQKQDAKYREALRLAKECTQLAPSNADCYLMLGTVEARLGNIDKGADHYRRYIELAPQNHPLRAGVLERLRTYDTGQQQKNPGG